MSVGKRSIIVAGSGRSGTTWIARVLASCRGCISVHEPLKRSIVPAVPLPEAFPDVPGLYLRATSPNAAWQSFFDDVFAGRISNHWTRGDCVRVPKWSEQYPLIERAFYRIAKYRYQLAERRADCRIVKMIRGNLLLAWLVRNFEFPVLYLLRHPCAVVASRLRWNWPCDLDGVFAQESLAQDYLNPYSDVLQECSTPLERMAALWCVENLVPLSQLPLVNVRAATYESFTDDPQVAFADLFSHFGLTPTRWTEKQLAAR